jgi:hypothetical protein
MERHIPRSIELAKLSDVRQSQHVAFLFKKGKKNYPINIGYNSKSHGMSGHNYYSCHAEISAVLHGPNRYSYQGNHKKSKKVSQLKVQCEEEAEQCPQTPQIQV